MPIKDFPYVSSLVGAVPVAAGEGHAQGVDTDGTYLYATNSHNIYKMTKAGGIVATRNDAHLDGTDLEQVNGVCVYGDYLYVGSTKLDVVYTNRIKVFNRSDLAYVEEHIIDKNHMTEGCTWYMGYWWVCYYDWMFVSRYDDNWTWQEDHALTITPDYVQGVFNDGNFLCACSNASAPATQSFPGFIDAYRYEAGVLVAYDRIAVPVEMEILESGGKESGVDRVWLVDMLLPAAGEHDGDIVLCSLTYYKPIVWGTASEYEDGIIHICKCCEIDTNKFVVVYADYGDGNAGKARIATVSGTTITWGAISEFCSDVSGSGMQLDVCKLDTDKFVVVYRDNTFPYPGKARVGTVSGTTISWGTANEFEDEATNYTGCCQLGTDKFAIAYQKNGVGTVCVCTVSGSTITSGTPVVFEGGVNYCRCCKLDTDKFMAFYGDGGDGQKAKACAFTVVGTVPTAGAIKEIDANNNHWMGIAQLDIDKVVIAWSANTGTTSKVEICTVSGTTITEGAEVELSDTNNNYHSLAKVDSAHFIVTYEDLGNAEKGTCRYCSFSGTTITLGVEELFHDAQIAYTGVCLIGANKVAVVFRDDVDASDHGEAIIGNTPTPGLENKSANMAAKMMAAGII